MLLIENIGTYLEVLDFSFLVDFRISSSILKVKTKIVIQEYWLKLICLITNNLKFSLLFRKE